MTEYIFEKPYEFEGKTYEKIEFDLDGLKGSDISEVKRRFASLGVYAPVPELDSEFCAFVLAHIAKQPIEFLHHCQHAIT